MTQDDYESVWYATSVVHYTGGRKHFFHFSFRLIMALAYQSNCKMSNITARWNALLQGYPELADKIDPPTPEDVRACWLLIVHLLQGGLPIEQVVNQINIIVEEIKCPVFTTVVNFIAYSRQTTVRLICEGDLLSLSLGVKYHIIHTKFVKTKFGESVVVDLEDTGACPQPEDKLFYVYLPKRWCDVFTEDQLKAVKPCVLSLCVTSHTSLANEKVSAQFDIDYVSMIFQYH